MYFGFLWISRPVSDAEMLVLTLRVVAGLDEKPSDVSCGNDVEDVLALELEEPVDNPVGTKFSVLHWILRPCG